jgi:cytochrome c oxidase cbb3-type subunit 4
MLRFIKHHLTGIDGVSIYPIFSLLIFFIFFAVMITYVIKMKKKEVNELSNIPFESNEEVQEPIVISNK